ncbi:MAG: ABC transporter permease subunit [Clostridium sp.]|uniref:ABC transporter permease subunit n=1 Tax=Clostridium sp. TaxID=1506 RepID=UPI003D6D58E5
MFLQIVKFELKKIIFSNKFKFVLLAMILISLFYSVQAKLEFPKYNEINVKSKIEYKKEIADINDFIKAPYEYLNGFYNKHPESVKADIISRTKDLEYYTSHQLPNLKKNFIQGFVKNFNSFAIYIVLIGIFCSNIISDEKAKNTLSFQFACKTKRSTLYNGKYVALIISIALLIIANIIFSLVTNGLILGFSDINGSIQQVRGFEMATVNMSILEFLTKKILTLFICCSSFACIFILVSSLFKNFLAPYIFCILLVSFGSVFLNEFEWTYFLPSTYILFDLIFYFGNSQHYNLTFTLISMLAQSIVVYILGQFIFKRMEIH